MKRITAAAIILFSAATLVLAACDDDSDTALPTETPAAGATVPNSQTTPTAGTPADFAQACQKSEEKQFSQPDLIIDTSKKYVATIKTAKGEILVELYSDTPTTTNNFVFLACKGFYDGLTFHRVVPGDLVQGGDPTGTGRGGPGYMISDEDDGGHLMEAGVISMAKAGPNTTGSQFFITYIPRPDLNADFTVFGEVTEGMDVAQQIAVGDVMETITIEEQAAS